MVYEPRKLHQLLRSPKKFVSFVAIAWNLRRVVIRLAQLHADSSSACEHSSCFTDIVDACRLAREAIARCEHFMRLSRGDRVYRDDRSFPYLRRKLFLLADRAYRSSLRHGYQTVTFLRELQRGNV